MESEGARTTVMLPYIRLMYDVEREARDMNLRADARKAWRQAKSVPILEDIKAYLEREQPAALPKSPEGGAIAYTLSNWEALIRYCDDGDLDIDNNGAERSLRAIAVGRRNWTFFGSDSGGRTAAIQTSITTLCKRRVASPAYSRCSDDRRGISIRQSPFDQIFTAELRDVGLYAVHKFLTCRSQVGAA